MKIVQSLWTAPIKGRLIEESRVKGGWLSEKYHHYSMALSCCLLKQFYSEVELITDESGAELLVEHLQLPYSRINSCLDEKLKGCPDILWVLPKLCAYEMQDTPFIHVDGDVYTWAPFDIADYDKRHFLIAQNPELEHHDAYEKPLAHFQATLQALPDCLRSSATTSSLLTAVNAGVLGGADIKFINDFASQALELITKNRDCLAKDPFAGFANTVIEQFFFKQLAETKNKKISYLFDKVGSDFKETLYFDQVPITTTYIHVLGKAKQRYYNCLQVENRLRYHFPEVYKKINTFHKRHNLFQEQNIFSPDGNALAPIYNIKWDSTPDITNSAQSSFKAKFALCYPNNEIMNLSFFERAEQRLSAIAIEENELINSNNTISIINGLGPYGFYRLSKVYSFMKDLNVHQILETSFTLSDSAAIFETSYESKLYNAFVKDIKDRSLISEENLFLVINKIENHGVYIQPLIEWDQLLTLFQGASLTGIDLIGVINESNPDEISQFYIEGLVFGFLCFHLVHTGNICITNID